MESIQDVHPENFSTFIPQIHLEMAHVLSFLYATTGMLGPKKPSGTPEYVEGRRSFQIHGFHLAGKSTMEFLNESMYFDFGNGKFPMSMLVFRYSKHVGGSVLIKHTP